MKKEEITEALWNSCCTQDEIEYKLSGTAGVIEILAERITDNAESSSLWLMRDVLETLADALSDQSSLLMQYRKHVNALEIVATKKKGKK